MLNDTNVQLPNVTKLICHNEDIVFSEHNYLHSVNSVTPITHLPLPLLTLVTTKILKVSSNKHTTNFFCINYSVTVLYFIHIVNVKHLFWKVAERPGNQGLIPGGGKRIFPLSFVSRLALGPTQPPVQQVPGVLTLGLKHGPGDTDHSPYLVLRSWMSRSYISSPPKHLCGV
jgi:hypothetical protein